MAVTVISDTDPLKPSAPLPRARSEYCRLPTLPGLSKNDTVMGRTSPAAIFFSECRLSTFSLVVSRYRASSTEEFPPCAPKVRVAVTSFFSLNSVVGEAADRPTSVRTDTPRIVMAVLDLSALLHVVHPA
jgi:hypothetical protein